MEGRGSFVVLLLGAVAVALVAQVRAETVQLITTKTESCLNCGMSAGQLDMKICGVNACCFTNNLDGGGLDFNSGATNDFSGSELGECNYFDVGPAYSTGLQVTFYHELSDGVDLDKAQIRTSGGLYECNGIPELDNSDYVSFSSCPRVG